MINVKKVYFTSVAIVLFIIIAGCVSTQPHVTPVPTAPQTTPTPAPQEKLPSKTIHPISVVASVQVTSPCSGNFCNPAGPSSRITMNVNASSTDVPVTQLSATVFFVHPYTPTSPVISVGFSFDISGRNPLMPNQT
ncbi:MAG: hypothetical protein O8C56_08175, partial [Candidatus Methanoperedens sp.]|nr:hypothetical protein [Candidatus Methanoperedens sp.]